MKDQPGFLAKLFGARPPAPGIDDDAGAAPYFVCSTCGRTDLPEVGDWDPPICEECDAAINFDSLLEADAFDD